jgi:hypothetical protein
MVKKKKVQFRDYQQRFKPWFAIYKLKLATSMICNQPNAYLVVQKLISEHLTSALKFDLQ